jgi:hypothetical protein
MMSLVTKLVYEGVTFLDLFIVESVDSNDLAFKLAIWLIIDFLAFFAQPPLPHSEPLLELEFSLNGVSIFTSSPTSKIY